MLTPLETRTRNTEKNSPQRSERLVLPKVPTPITYNVLVQRLQKLGLREDPKYFDYKPRYDVKVTSGKSSFNFTEAEINIDEPLIQYYNETYLEVARPADSGDAEETSAEIVNNQKIEVGGLARIGFRRTIRVPDNNKTHALPPDMGPFTLYNTADFANKLPPSVSSKGGICIAMYQREAMWISFTAMEPCAVKVSIGGINAITGTPRNVSVPGTQDYLALGDEEFGQLWLDGVATAPGVVRQFVAVPLGKGLTVEGQLTGREVEGGVQFDIFPLNSTRVAFQIKTADDVSEHPSIHKTPRQIGLAIGACLSMEDTPQMKRLVPNYGELSTNQLTPQLLVQGIQLHASVSPNPRKLIDVIVKTLLGNTMSVSGVAQSDPVSVLKDMIENIAGIAPDQQRLVFEGKYLEDNRTLQDYNIQDKSVIFMIFSLRGGGDITDLGGIAVGGRISQKINKDINPTTAYNFKKAARLHVSIINAPVFPKLTGLPPPPSPVSAATYLAKGFPWFELYDEHIPAANTSTPGNLTAKLKSIGALLKKSPSSSKSIAPGCGGCKNNLSTMALIPCRHNLCDVCGDKWDRCPVCQKDIAGWRRFAAHMGVDEAINQHGEGVEAGSNDARIKKLRLNRGTSQVTTFKSDKEAVSRLNSDGKD